MSKAKFMDMESLPSNTNLYETNCIMIHGGHYRVMMDGLDTYIYKYENLGGEKETLHLLCRLPGSEQTEQLGVALIRAATAQRKEEAKR
jgi:hypothetical protein